MAGSVQPRAGETNHELATTSEQKPKLGASIAAGILVGAVAAVIVGGLVGMHESTTSVLVQHSVSAP